MANGALEQSALEAKDRDQLLAIAKALGVKSAGRAKKEEIIEMILEQTAPSAPSAPASAAPAPTSSRASASSAKSESETATSSKIAALGADGQSLSEWEIELAEHEGTPVAPEARRRTEQTESRSDNREFRDNRAPREPRNDTRNDGRDNRNNGPRNYNDQDGGNRNRNRNRRRRTPGGFRNTRDDGPQGADRYESNEIQESNEPINNDPIEVSGYLDLRVIHQQHAQ